MSIDTATASEFRLLEQIGETAETLPELEELQSIQRTVISSIHSLTQPPP